MSCPICNHTELEEGADNCPQCGSDLEIFTHIENAKKENTFQKKAGLVLTASLGLVLVSWGSTSFFSGDNKAEVAALPVAENTEIVVPAEDPLNIADAGKPVEEFVKENEEAKPEVAPLTAEKVTSKEPVVAAEKAPVVKEKEKVVKPAAPANEGGVIIHKVRKGDSFWKISKKYFGNGNHARKIAADNGLNPKKNIPLGTKLKINK